MIRCAPGNQILEQMDGRLCSLWHVEELDHREQIDVGEQMLSAIARRPGVEQLTLAEHGQILGAIERGESDAAARLTADHLNRANTLYNQANFRP